MNPIFSQHQGFFNEVNELYNRYLHLINNPGMLDQARNLLTKVFDTYYCKGRIFHSSNAGSKFIDELMEKRGGVAAAGAYASLLGVDAGFSLQQNQIPADVIRGVIEGFLFQNGIQWTASAHQKILAELENQARGIISNQQSRLDDIERENLKLNKQFADDISQKASALDSLHAAQSDEFKSIVEKHGQQVEDLEETYNRKLALQKPIDYWQEKEKFHRDRLRVFGRAVVIIPTLLAVALVGFCYLVLTGDKQAESPKHWQIGMLLVAAFFVIWFSRIVVRLFLSHHHLATDASERKIMIQTYLSLSREGSPYSPDDRKIILQQIFRSASDGLVKDDATPKTPTEFITR